MSNVRSLQLFMNAYCHLCDEMKAELESLRDRYGYSIEYIDIEGNQALEDRLGEKIPVLMAQEKEICHYHLDRNALDAHFSDLVSSPHFTPDGHTLS